MIKLEIEFESEIFFKLNDYCHYKREFDPFSVGIVSFIEYLPTNKLLFNKLFTPLMNELHRNFNTIW